MQAAESRRSGFQGLLSWQSSPIGPGTAVFRGHARAQTASRASLAARTARGHAPGKHRALPRLELLGRPPRGGGDLRIKEWNRSCRATGSDRGTGRSTCHRGDVECSLRRRRRSPAPPRRSVSLALVRPSWRCAATAPAPIFLGGLPARSSRSERSERSCLSTGRPPKKTSGPHRGRPAPASSPRRAPASRPASPSRSPSAPPGPCRSDTAPRHRLRARRRRRRTRTPGRCTRRGSWASSCRER